ncbi:right-handed parallel beta-helix repeat-containing protein [Rhodoferax fermentans]|uniref:right-handed parallel beta-helix repeat-containing protein n=1 Tax=Rhodoferax fermentans TaxID=28066 RepID=UPI000992C1CD|nr:right-handed parallel beta-helix repeat-containing protein [Rhodoferax fermentans]MBK1682898.1 right-handed parallel beta-helix repeat-containing protein [Rhodoferax fermentans]
MSCSPSVCLQGLALSLSLVATGCLGSDLKIAVFLPSALASSSLPSCDVNAVQACKTTLADAIQVIKTSQWQNALVGRYSKVRLDIAPGVYRLSTALDLQWGKGPTHGIPLEIQGSARSTVISGATPLDNWAAATVGNTPARVPESIRSRLKVADISALDLPLQIIPHAWGYGLPIRPVLTELFVSGSAQPLAGWPNAGYGKLARPGGLAPEDKKTFSIEGRNVSDWLAEPSLQIHAFWGNNWSAQSYLVSSKDPSTNTLTLLGNGSPYGILSGQRARVENALVELDSPGEWYVDRGAAKLFYLPGSSFTGKDTELSIAAQLLNIRDSEQVTVKGLIFEKTTGDAVHVSRSSGIVFADLVIRLTGNRGLVIADSADSGIRNSLIEDNGEGGVYLSGGNRTTLRAAGNFVDACIIRRYSRLVKTYRYAVEFDGVGQRVKGSTISDAPHAAIFFKGNDHVISNNEIFNVVRETGDSGAIYVGRDYTVQGTVIENNFLHDITAQSKELDVKGVYVDDQASGITIRGNIFARVQQPVFLGGGRDNVVEKNLFFQSSPALHLDARGLTSQRPATLDPNGTLQRGLDAVPYRDSVYKMRFPNLAKIREDDLGAPKYNVFRNNTIIEGQMANVLVSARSGIEILNNKEVGVSIFEKSMPDYLRVTREDFRTKEY